jgi:hypothetical protein
VPQANPGLGDAIPLGLGVLLGWRTQGRPSFLRPTLGWGTQSRWDWGSCWEGTQGRPSCRRPTLGWGTQSRWDWGSCWERTQGRPSCRRPTLGWGTQSRWDWGSCWEGTQGRPSCRRPTLGWGTQSRWDWGCCWDGGPRVGLRSSGQPWAGGRNPVGIGGCWYGGQGRDALATAGGLRGRRAVMAGISKRARGKKEPPGLKGIRRGRCRGL